MAENFKILKDTFSKDKRLVIKKLNEKYGTNVKARLTKFCEEAVELVCASSDENYLSDESKQDFIDELADVNVVVFHIASILGKTQDQLLFMALDKIIGRESDPNYKRKHPHKDGGSES